MSVATGTVAHKSGRVVRTVTEVRYGDREKHAVKQFIVVDRALAIAGMVFVTGVKVVSIESTRAWLILAVLLFLVVCLAAAERLLVTGRPVLHSLVLIIVGNWMSAIAVSIEVPFLWPTMALTILMAVLLATPFLERLQVVWIMVAAGVAAGVVSGIGLLSDDQGITAEISSDWQAVIVIATLITVIMPIGLIVWHNNRIQYESLVRATELNELLLESQAELAASRRRVVVAGDIERRRIERNLHDGAQQRLLAIGLRLRILEAQTDHLPEISGSLEALIEEIDSTIEDVRDLAHGIYPPLLESLGLAEALAVVAQRSSVPVQSDLAGIGRLDPSIEAALYFTALEALTNSAKHAPASTVQLGLVDNGSTVTLSVIDDGPGFEVNEDHLRAPNGFGDRVAAVGGTLNVRSKPGGGTTVVAVAPKAPVDPPLRHLGEV